MRITPFVFCARVSRGAASIQFGTGYFGYLSPLRQFFAHQLREFRGRVADRLYALGEQAFPHLRVEEAFDYRLIELRDDLARRFGGGDKPEPRVDLEAGQHGLRHGGRAGCFRRT